MPVLIHAADKAISFAVFYGIAVFFNLPVFLTVLFLYSLEALAYLYLTRKNGYRMPNSNFKGN